MPKDKIFHNSFRYRYPVIVKEIITEVKVDIPLFLKTDKEHSFKEFRALWDTGATNSVITQKVVDLLNLIPTGKAHVLAVHNIEIVDTYIIDIVLPNKVYFPNVTVSFGKLLGSDIDIIIGMDIISAGDFALSNANNKTTFSYCYPPFTKNPIDLYEKCKRTNPKQK